MSWTVACFCGNVYTAPPNRCDECGCTLVDCAPSPTASATGGHALPTAPPPSDALNRPEARPCGLTSQNASSR
jgi:hypothetical protein